MIKLGQICHLFDKVYASMPNNIFNFNYLLESINSSFFIKFCKPLVLFFIENTSKTNILVKAFENGEIRCGLNLVGFFVVFLF